MRTLMKQGTAVAMLVVACLFAAVGPTLAAETQQVAGPFGTTIGVSEVGCRTEQSFSVFTKTLHVEEPIVRNAGSTSFATVRLSVFVYSKATAATSWRYEPGLSYSRVVGKSFGTAVQPQPVVSFATASLPINLAYRGQITVIQRLEYLDRSGVRVAPVVDLQPTPYTFVYSYSLGINQYVRGVCQF